MLLPLMARWVIGRDGLQLDLDAMLSGGGDVKERRLKERVERGAV